MATKNEENWMMHYNELKAYVAVHHHFPLRLTTQNNWDLLSKEAHQGRNTPKRALPFFEELAASRHLMSIHLPSDAQKMQLIIANF